MFKNNCLYETLNNRVVSTIMILEFDEAKFP